MHYDQVRFTWLVLDGCIEASFILALSFDLSINIVSQILETINIL